MPLDRVGEWIGTETNATKTQRLDFFADTDFLRLANVVDTPGTRSVIQTHEDATQGFLADKLESDSLRYGGSADAVIYAVNPVGRESDRDLLQLFGERTRLPGASAYNSIAVVQKWEPFCPTQSKRFRKNAECSSPRWRVRWPPSFPPVVFWPYTRKECPSTSGRTLRISQRARVRPRLTRSSCPNRTSAMTVLRLRRIRHAVERCCRQ
jgi:hypothetical protein